ncbi:MAG: GlpG protein [Oleispira sp.]|jgi:GlpG protein
MDSILVFQASSDINLSPITERLWQASIPHRVVINGNRQDLWVARAEDAEQVRIWVEAWQSGKLSAKPDKTERTPWQVKAQQKIIQCGRFPVTVMMLLLLVALFFFQQIGLLEMEAWLLRADLWSGNKLDFSSFWDNDFYRWWSPALIHLSFMHLLMNSFWWWILAKEIEVYDGHVSLIVLTLVLAVSSAFAQYLAVGPFFAGLSGVTYGLMGWAWGRHSFKHARYQLPSWLFPFMMISMLVIMLVDEAGMALNIGHESHLAGAIMGVVLALVWPQNKRSSVNKEFEGEDDDS